jgi:hypothetical protein
MSVRCELSHQTLCKIWVWCSASPGWLTLQRSRPHPHLVGKQLLLVEMTLQGAAHPMLAEAAKHQLCANTATCRSALCFLSAVTSFAPVNYCGGPVQPAMSHEQLLSAERSRPGVQAHTVQVILFTRHLWLLCSQTLSTTTVCRTRRMAASVKTALAEA